MLYSFEERTPQLLGDNILYVIRLASMLDININEAITAKIAINNAKYLATKVKGSAKKCMSN